MDPFLAETVVAVAAVMVVCIILPLNAGGEGEGRDRSSHHGPKHSSHPSRSSRRVPRVSFSCKRISVTSVAHGGRSCDPVNHDDDHRDKLTAHMFSVLREFREKKGVRCRNGRRKRRILFKRHREDDVREDNTMLCDVSNSIRIILEFARRAPWTLVFASHNGKPQREV